jgi:hypothetical protein
LLISKANLHSAKKLDDSIQEVQMNNGFIATLWLQLTDIYGMRFINLYGEKDSGVWFQALRDLTEEEIERGLHAMFRDERFETWPPNCTQFRHLCLKRNKLPSVHKAFNEARHNLNFLSLLGVIQQLNLQ